MAYYDKKIQIHEVKVCLLGDCGVGKSSLVLQFVTGKFSTMHSPTIGASFLSRTFTIGKNNESYKFEIWDTAGQERFKSLTPMYYRNCAAAILVYDISSELTFDNIKSWISDLKRFGPPNIIIVIVGNKRDLPDEREVESHRGLEYATSIGAIFVEVSAKKNENISLIFEEICERIVSDKEDLIEKKSSGKKRGASFKERFKLMHHSEEMKNRKKGCC